MTLINAAANKINNKKPVIAKLSIKDNQRSKNNNIKKSNNNDVPSFDISTSLSNNKTQILETDTNPIYSLFQPNQLNPDSIRSSINNNIIITKIERINKNPDNNNKKITTIDHKSYPMDTSSLETKEMRDFFTKGEQIEILYNNKKIKLTTFQNLMTDNTDVQELIKTINLDEKDKLFIKDSLVDLINGNSQIRKQLQNIIKSIIQKDNIHLGDISDANLIRIDCSLIITKDEITQDNITPEFTQNMKMKSLNVPNTGGDYLLRSQQLYTEFATSSDNKYVQEIIKNPYLNTLSLNMLIDKENPSPLAFAETFRQLTGQNYSDILSIICEISLHEDCHIIIPIQSNQKIDAFIKSVPEGKYAYLVIVVNNSKSQLIAENTIKYVLAIQTLLNKYRIDYSKIQLKSDKLSSIQLSTLLSMFINKLIIAYESSEIFTAIKKAISDDTCEVKPSQELAQLFNSLKDRSRMESEDKSNDTDKSIDDESTDDESTDTEN